MIRILHLVDNFLSFGGGEIFLNDLISHMPAERIQFLCTVVADKLVTPDPTYPVPLVHVNDVNLDELVAQADVLLYSGRTGAVLERCLPIGVRILMAHSDFNVQWYLEHTARYATHLLAVSGRVKEAVKYEPCEVIWPGIDFKSYNILAERDDVRSLFGLSPDDYVIGQFSRVTKFKNMEMIVDAVAPLDSKVKLLVVGHGPHLCPFLEYAQAALTDRFRHVYYSDVRQIGTFYNAIDAFCHGSKGEGCPRVLWESLYYGKPFIGTPVGSIPEILQHGVTGFIVNDAEEMRVAIEQARSGVLSEDAMRKVASSQGTIEVTVEKFVPYIERLILSQRLL